MLYFGTCIIHYRRCHASSYLFVDYRDAKYESEDNYVDDSNTEYLIFEQDCCDNDKQNIVVGNNIDRLGGRSSDTDKLYERQSLILRSKLRLLIMNHDMH